MKERGSERERAYKKSIRCNQLYYIFFQIIWLLSSMCVCVFMTLIRIMQSNWYIYDVMCGGGGSVLLSFPPPLQKHRRTGKNVLYIYIYREEKKETNKQTHN